MASTFFGLTIASSGLRAANAALNTTGNNISNVNTAGYSRQQVTQVRVLRPSQLNASAINFMMRNSGRMRPNLESMMRKHTTAR